jgi:hypothetical protein
MNTLIEPALIVDYLRDLLLWAHGYQIKSIATFVVAIIEKQTGNQVELARTLGNHEAAVKRLSRLIHNDRLKPRRPLPVSTERSFSRSRLRKSPARHRRDY